MQEDCESVQSGVCETSQIQCRHVTANYYVNPPWSSPSQRLLPCPPVPSPSVPATPPLSLAVYCPMTGTVRRLDSASPRLPTDDAGSTAYVPMNIYSRVDTGTGCCSPHTGSDVMGSVVDNIYEPLDDVSLSERQEE